MLDLEFYCNRVREIALEAGAFLKEERLRFSIDLVEEKSSHNYVSYVDKESERRLVEKLSELLPQSGFIAEEGTVALADEKLYWVIDPLDGTTNYIHDSAPYCVSIALRNREELLLGVVYEVCRDELYYAYKGSKAFLNGQEINVSDVKDLDKAFIGLGLPYNFTAYKPIANHLLEELYGEAGGIRILGSAAVEICYIAAGRFEARIEAFLGAWDVAAAAIILKQAGGSITDFKGSENFYSGEEVLASNGLIHSELLKIMNSLR